VPGRSILASDALSLCDLNEASAVKGLLARVRFFFDVGVPFSWEKCIGHIDIYNLMTCFAAKCFKNLQQHTVMALRDESNICEKQQTVLSLAACGTDIFPKDCFAH